jgi:hypothetical protein
MKPLSFYALRKQMIMDGRDTLHARKKQKEDGTL